jgi:hypothetical protein
MRAFRLTLDNALLFYEMCLELKADTEEKRLAIMDAMVQFGKVEQVTDTPKTKEEYIKHLSKHFKCAIVHSTDDAQQEKYNGSD